MSPVFELRSPAETVQMRRSRMPEEVHRPKQSEEAREEPLAGGAGAGHGFGKQHFYDKQSTLLSLKQ